MQQKKLQGLNLKRFEKIEKKYFEFFTRKFSTDYVIDIRIDSFIDFYNKYDPSPLSYRQLNDDIECYLLQQMQNADQNTNIILNFYIMCHEQKDILQIEESCINHFKGKAFEQYMLNKRKRRLWQISLFLGLLFLAFCLAVANFLRQVDGAPLFAILSEGFGIIGWVALWEPATYLLYGHRQDKYTLWNYMRLQRAKIHIIPCE